MVSSFPFRRPTPFQIPEEYREFQRNDEIPDIPLAHTGSTYVVTQYEDVRHCLSSTSFSIQRTHPNYPSPLPIPESFRTNGSMLSMDPPEHTALRSKIQAEFTAQRTRERTPMVHAIVNAHLTRFLQRPSRTGDIAADFAVPMALEVVSTLLGLPSKDVPALFEATQGMFAGDRTQEERVAAITFLEDYFDSFVQERIDSPHDDLMGRVITKNPELTKNEFIHLARLMMNGGHDSVASTISLSVVLLLHHHDIYKRLAQEPELVTNVVEELLRLLSVTDLATARVAAEPVSIRNHQIPEGAGVYPSTAAANRDPSVFPNPDSFDPERANIKRHVTFGHGRHRCLGADFARLELREVLTALSTRVPSLALAVPEEELHFQDRGFVYKAQAVPVQWSEQDASSSSHMAAE